MGMACSICPNEHRAGIDSAILKGHSSGYIAQRYSVSRMAAWRHRACLRVAIQKADSLSGRRVLMGATRIVNRLEAMAEETDSAKERDDYYKLVRELRPTLQLLGSVNGEITAASIQAFMATLGVSGEPELRSALAVTRQQVTADDMREESIEALLFCWREHPEMREADLARLGREVSSAAIVETNGNGANGHG